MFISSLELLALITDNHPANGTLIDSLVLNFSDHLYPHFNRSTSWIRCFAHIINLAAQVSIPTYFLLFDLFNAFVFRFVVNLVVQAAISVLRKVPGNRSGMVDGDSLDGSDIAESVLKKLSLLDKVSKPFLLSSSLIRLRLFTFVFRLFLG